MRDIIIKPALNGYVVRLGCQRIVFPTRDLMMRALSDYLDNPEKIEEQYKYGSLNSKQLGFTRERKSEEIHTVDCASHVYIDGDED